jgi:hypothetical protein
MIGGLDVTAMRTNGECGDGRCIACGISFSFDSEHSEAEVLRRLCWYLGSLHSRLVAGMQNGHLIYFVVPFGEEESGPRSRVVKVVSISIVPASKALVEAAPHGGNHGRHCVTEASCTLRKQWISSSPFAFAFASRRYKAYLGTRGREPSMSMSMSLYSGVSRREACGVVHSA